MKNYTKFILAVLFIVIIIFLTAGCTGEQQTAEIQSIGVSSAFDLVNERADDSGFVILDVRTPAEFATGHIAESINVNVEAGDFRSRISTFDKNNTYLVYCRTGRRSLDAARIMTDSGFTSVYNMMEGITSWQAAGYPVVE